MTLVHPRNLQVSESLTNSSLFLLPFPALSRSPFPSETQKVRPGQAQPSQKQHIQQIISQTLLLQLSAANK
jgi:hypothetical protein